MELNINRTAISDGIYFTELSSKKFKNNRISVSLVAPLSEETASSYALLPLILKKGYRDIPDPKDFSKKLTSLYGAYLDCDVQKQGDNQLIRLYSSFIDDKYTLNGEKITEEISKILCGVLLNPVIEEGSFRQSVFETEKKALIDAIKAKLNDKQSLAASRCIETMFEGEAYSVDSLGSLESAQNLTCNDAFNAYNLLLKKARIEILFVGGGNAEIAKEIFSSAFLSSADREEPYKIETLPKYESEEIKEQNDYYNITQSKLSLGFTCDSGDSPLNLDAMKIMCTVLGGAPFSKLFLNVREKMSLCYYCSARYDKFKNVMLINSAIETEDKEKAQEEILNQLKEIQNGNITDEEMQSTRKAYENAFNGIYDSISMIEIFFLPKLVAGENILPEEELKNLLNVSKDDIIEAAKKVKLDTVYFMSPKEEK